MSSDTLARPRGVRHHHLGVPSQGMLPSRGDAFERRTVRARELGLPSRPRCVLSAQHAGEVLRVAGAAPDALPRWGVNSPIRGDEPVPGARAGRIGWTSRAHYLETTVPSVLDEHLEALKAHKVARDTFMRWITAETLYVQQRRSGRSCIVRPSTLAGLLGCAKRTVQRCRAAAAELGLRIEVVAGRMLSLEECLAARKAGSPQRGLSAVADFCVPPTHKPERASHSPSSGDAVVCRVTPTSGDSLQENPDCFFPSEHRLTASRKDAASRRRQPRRVDSPGWKLAHSLILRVPWASSLPPGRLAPLVTRFAKAERPWTSSQLVAAMDQINVGSGPFGYTSPTRGQVKRPLGLIKWYLDQVDELRDHPYVDAPPTPQRTQASEPTRSSAPPEPPHVGVPMPPHLRQQLKQMLRGRRHG